MGYAASNLLSTESTQPLRLHPSYGSGFPSNLRKTFVIVDRRLYRSILNPPGHNYNRFFPVCQRFLGIVIFMRIFAAF